MKQFMMIKCGGGGGGGKKKIKWIDGELSFTDLNIWDLFYANKSRKLLCAFVWKTRNARANKKSNQANKSKEISRQNHQ